MKLYLENKDGITIRQLKQLLSGWPEDEGDGTETTVWIETGDRLSSPCVRACRLNRDSILLESDAFVEDGK